jgi:small subunit ribosomal protein S1
MNDADQHPSPESAAPDALEHADESAHEAAPLEIDEAALAAALAIVTSEVPAAEPHASAAAEESAPVEHTHEPLAEDVAVPVAPVEAVADAPAAEAVAAALRPPKVPPEEVRARAQAAWDHVAGAKEANTTVQGVVTAVVKGGLLVDVGGIRGFLPASQVRLALGTQLDTLVKTTVPLKVLDLDAPRRRIVVSHRRALEDERRSKRAALLSSLAIGQVRDVTVARLTDFGAFVDLGGIDGLVPMSELALERIDKAADVVSVGDTFPATVLRIEEGGRKIALSRKAALPDPWRDHAALLRQGNTVEGTVVAKEPRLMVELAPGIVGSVRESDADPADYAIGEKIEVQVRMLDRRTRRITLAMPYGAALPTTTTGFAPLGVELKSRR